MVHSENDMTIPLKWLTRINTGTIWKFDTKILHTHIYVNPRITDTYI